MAKACAEVLPDRRGRTGIVGREEQSEHEDEAAKAGGANEDAKRKSDADGQLAVGHKEGDGRGVRQDESAENRSHERVGAALFEEAVNPELKAAVKSELSGEDFVLAEDEEEEADADPKNSHGTGVQVVWGVGIEHEGWLPEIGRQERRARTRSLRALPSTTLPSSADFAALTTAPICFRE